LISFGHYSRIHRIEASLFLLGLKVYGSPHIDKLGLSEERQ